MAKPVITRGTALLALLIVLASGCSSFRVFVPATPPDQMAPAISQSPQVRARVAIANFEVDRVDAQYSSADVEKFRVHFSVAVPNELFQRAASSSAFARMTRIARPDGADADVIVTGV